jgi:hypothetical protein
MKTKKTKKVEQKSVVEQIYAVKKKDSKADKCRKHLLSGKPLTQREASKAYGNDRLAVTINGMRNAQVPINTEWVKKVDKFGLETKVFRYSVDPKYITNLHKKFN